MTARKLRAGFRTWEGRCAGERCWRVDELKSSSLLQRPQVDAGWLGVTNRSRLVVYEWVNFIHVTAPQQNTLACVQYVIGFRILQNAGHLFTKGPGRAGSHANGQLVSRDRLRLSAKPC